MSRALQFERFSSSDGVCRRFRHQADVLSKQHNRTHRTIGRHSCEQEALNGIPYHTVNKPVTPAQFQRWIARDIAESET